MPEFNSGLAMLRQYNCRRTNRNQAFPSPGSEHFSASGRGRRETPPSDGAFDARLTGDGLMKTNVAGFPIARCRGWEWRGDTRNSREIAGKTREIAGKFREIAGKSREISGDRGRFREQKREKTKNGEEKERFCKKYKKQNKNSSFF